MPNAIGPTTSLPLVRQFENVVANHPEAMALIDENKSVSYHELNEQVNQLAHLLISKGLSKQRIGLSGQSKYQMLLGQLAIMKANSTFVVFDSKDPCDRVVFIAKNAGITSLLHCGDTPPDGSLIEAVPGMVLYWNELESILEGYGKDNPECVLDDISPAYLLYTSGSTANQPKGVIQTQQNVIHQIYRYTRDLGLRPQDKLLQLATLSHDQAIVDSYAALLNGAALVLVDNQLDTASVLATIKNQGITVFSSIPSMFELIFRQADADECLELRIITIGGEETTLAHAELFQRIASPSCQLINGYGATECSWISSFAVRIDTDLSQFKAFPLGKLTEGLDFIIDPSDDYEMSGELLIQGDGVSPGYWNNDVENGKAFVVIAGKTYYRTGDIVSLDDEMCCHFLGRVTWHEKIRGQRVNTKEIEDIFLKQLPGKEYVVIAAGEGMAKKLVLCVAGNPENKESILEQIKMIATDLRDYMRPAHVLYLENMPYLANGKINRHALRERFLLDNSVSTPTVSEPIVDAGWAKVWVFIEDLWQKTLRCDLKKDGKFFELGGNSLLAKGMSVSIYDYFAKEYRVLIWLSVATILGSDLSDLKFVIINQFEGAKCDGNKLIDGDNPQLFKDLNALVISENDEHYGRVSYVAKDYFSLVVNYAAMCVLAEHYNKKYGVRIIPCESYEHFTTEVINAIRWAVKPLQIGLTWPKDNSKAQHPVPCLLSVDDAGKITLVLSDSIGKSDEYADTMCEHFSKVLDVYPELKLIRIILDNDKRQTDPTSCSTDAICYLKNILQCDFLPQTDIYDNKIICAKPPEAFKTYQCELPSDVNVNARFFSRPGKKLSDHRNQYNRDVTFFSVTHKVPDITALANVYLYEKSKKFEDILTHYKDDSRAASSSSSEPSSSAPTP